MFFFFLLWGLNQFAVMVTAVVDWFGCLACVDAVCTMNMIKQLAALIGRLWQFASTFGAPR